MKKKQIVPKLTNPELSELKIGDTFSGVYFAVEVHPRLASTGKQFTDIVLQDKSGKFTTRMWFVADKIKSGSWVVVIGFVEDYQGASQIMLTQVDETKEPEDLSSFMPTVDKPKHYEGKLQKYIDWISWAFDEKIIDENFGDFPKDAPFGGGLVYGCRGGSMKYAVDAVYLAVGKAAAMDISSVEKSYMAAGIIRYAKAVGLGSTFVGPAPVYKNETVIGGRGVRALEEMKLPHGWKMDDEETIRHIYRSFLEVQHVVASILGIPEKKSMIGEIAKESCRSLLDFEKMKGEIENNEVAYYLGYAHED